MTSKKISLQGKKVTIVITKWNLIDLQEQWGAFTPFCSPSPTLLYIKYMIGM